MLNSAVAESLRVFADKLEGAEDFDSALHELIKSCITAHKRIIFNGNGYDDSWIKEATEKRGLLNLRTTPDCMPAVLSAKNMDMLIRHKVFTEAEIRSRYEIMMENYCKTVSIEAHTMVDMAKKEILPAIEAYTIELSDAVRAKKAADAGASCRYEEKRIRRLSALLEQIDDAVDELESVLVTLSMSADITAQANFIRDEIIPKMSLVRVPADEAETLTAEKYWPFPTYGELLFGV